MAWLKAFTAGFIATLIFHQGVLGLLWLAGIAPTAPYNMAATPPFGVPAVLSLAFWGGLWGLPLWWLLRSLPTRRYWPAALAAGAVFPTLVAILIVFPLKELPVSLQVMIGGLLVNGAWGAGTALVLRLLSARKTHGKPPHPGKP